MSHNKLQVKRLTSCLNRLDRAAAPVKAVVLCQLARKMAKLLDKHIGLPVILVVNAIESHWRSDLRRPRQYSPDDYVKLDTLFGLIGELKDTARREGDDVHFYTLDTIDRIMVLVLTADEDTDRFVDKCLDRIVYMANVAAQLEYGQIDSGPAFDKIRDQCFEVFNDVMDRHLDQITHAN